MEEKENWKSIMEDIIKLTEQSKLGSTKEVMDELVDRLGESYPRTVR